MSARHLVTGAAGVIGFELVRQLCATGDRVVAIDAGLKGGIEDLQRLADEHPRRLDVVAMDLARPDRPIADAERFDSIFHLAAIVGVRYVNEHPYETLDVNLRSTLNVLEHARAHPPRVLVFASSSENYACTVQAGHAPIPTPEDVSLSIDDIELPRWSYAASKIAGEAAVFAAAKTSPFTPIVVRFHNVYGPRMGETHVIPEFLARCRERLDPFPVYGEEQTRSFLYVEDAARALRTVLAARESGIYNIGTSVETRIGDLAQLAFEITGHHPRIERRAALPGSVARRVPDVTKLTQLGFRAQVPLEEGVRLCWNN